MTDSYWIKKNLVKDTLLNFKLMVKTGSGYDKCLAFFFVLDGNVDEVRLWDEEESIFVMDLPKEVFEDKSIDQMKLYLETIMRIDGKI